MFVVHTKTPNGWNSCDYGHVNQFYRWNPEWRAAKECSVWKKCIVNGFVYIKDITYHNTLDELLNELGEK